MQEQVFAIAHYIDHSVLYLLIFLSLASTVMIFERYFYLRGIIARSKKTQEKVKIALKDVREETLNAVAEDDRTLEGRVVSQALVHVKRAGERGLEEIFNAFTLLEKPQLERSLNFLATVGSNAPYIGLFGTVLGIMKAFNDMAQAQEAGQQAVMAGISSALIATAAGLMVAIPSVIAYNYFQKRVKSIIQSIEVCRELCLTYAKQREV